MPSTFLPGHPQGVVALLGNHVQFGVVEALPSIPHVKSNDLKPLAIFSPQRDPHFPNVPTFAELGYPDVMTYSYFLSLRHRLEQLHRL